MVFNKADIFYLTLCPNCAILLYKYDNIAVVYANIEYNYRKERDNLNVKKTKTNLVYG